MPSISNAEVDTIVREEVGKWLSNIWLDSSPKVTFSLCDGCDQSFAPYRAHETDAGADLSAAESGIVPAHDSRVFSTGICVQLPKRTAGLLVSRSGLNTKKSITSTGLIDEGYSGKIMVRLYNHGDNDYLVNRGDRITQLVIFPVLYPTFEVGDVTGGERGTSGYGSTGR